VHSFVALTVAAVAATVALAPAAVEPPPIAAGKQSLSAAERTINCRNTANDATLINRRIANSKVGDEIIFNGPCLVNQTIKLLGNRAYRGTSRTGTVIKQADGANLDAIFASDGYLDNTDHTGEPIALRTMSIDANSANNPTAHDSIVLRSWQSIVEDIQIDDSTRHGIRLTSLSQNRTEITNTQVNGRISSMQINDSGGSGVYVEDPGNHVTDWQLKDNYIAGTGGYGVSLDNTAGWIISGNHIYGVDGNYALRCNRLFGSSISDNYIEDFGTYGIVARIQGDAASTISNNRIFKFNGGSGTFLLVEGSYGNGKVAVTGNAIRGNGEGIGIEYRKGNAASLEVTSTGNLVTDVTTPRLVGDGVILNPGVRVADNGTF
jgi:parallel beta helix pectate lyase-like protein